MSAPRANAGLGVPPEFDVAWSPEDAALTWEWDELHNPAPLTPLGGDYFTFVGGGLDPAFAWFGSPMRVKSRIIAGYWYLGVDLGVPPDEVGPMLERLHQAERDFAPETSRYWRDEALPQVLEISDRIRAVDVDRLPGPALADAWDARWQDLDRVWEIHFITLRPAKRVAEDLSDLYTRIVPDAESVEAVALVQGRNDILQAVEARVERLVELVAGQREVADRLRLKPTPSIDEIRHLAGAAFADELQSFLAEHGHMGQPFGDLTEPSWSQDPGALLVEVAKRLDDPPERSAKRRDRLRAESERCLGRARARLEGRPDELAAFDRLVEMAHEVSPLTETHNYWIDRRIQADMRALALRVGAWVARDGSIADPADVFYLTRTEIADLLRQSSDQKDVVRERRAEHEHQKTLNPPPTLGRVDSASGPGAQSERPGDLGEVELKGVGASRGIARGIARVVLGPADFERIRRGDIIVCPNSNPSWVPVFAIAGGLVANTGGLLAHAAVVAREFGLPAVVGVSRATSRIADGRPLEIDGSSGVVRLL